MNAQEPFPCFLVLMKSCSANSWLLWEGSDGCNVVKLPEQLGICVLAYYKPRVPLTACSLNQGDCRTVMQHFTCIGQASASAIFLHWPTLLLAKTLYHRAREPSVKSHPLTKIVIPYWLLPSEQQWDLRKLCRAICLRSLDVPVTTQENTIALPYMGMGICGLRISPLIVHPSTHLSPPPVPPHTVPTLYF